MDADAQNSASASQNEQLTAPPGWTKKLVPAKGKYVTLRKHDVVFVAPDGQEVPSQWHLRRYLKAHPGGPTFSDFDWSSGEESVRRSARVSTREPNVTEIPRTKRKAKRNASEMDAEGAEEDTMKTPVRKRAKKADKPADTDGASAVKDVAVLPDKDVVMHEAPEGSAISGKPDDQDAAPVTDVMKGVDAEISAIPVTEGQKDRADAEEVSATLVIDGHNVADAQKLLDEATEAQGEAENKPPITATDVATEVEPKVIIVDEIGEMKEQVEDVKPKDNEPQSESEPKAVSGLIPDDKLKGENAVIESEKPLEPPAGETVVESKEQFDQNSELREDNLKVTTETHVSEEHQEAEKKSLEPLMQKEEQERLHSVHNSPLKVEHMKEKSPKELSNSPVPLSVGNQ